MGFIRERKLKDGHIRYQAEIRLKGHPMLTAGFDRKSDAKTWIQKTEADIRCGRHQLYSEGKKHIFADAVDKYSKEHPISVAKKGHLEFWKKELGVLQIQDVRPSIISEKKQKLLSQPNKKEKLSSRSRALSVKKDERMGKNLPKPENVRVASKAFHGGNSTTHAK
jgi:hypothetical protein